MRQVQLNQPKGKAESRALVSRDLVVPGSNKSLWWVVFNLFWLRKPCYLASAGAYLALLAFVYVDHRGLNYISCVCLNVQKSSSQLSGIWCVCMLGWNKMLPEGLQEEGSPLEKYSVSVRNVAEVTRFHLQVELLS